MDKNIDDTTIIVQTLKEYFSLEQARCKMYHTDDIYFRIPRLIFKLRDKEVCKYEEIKVCIENYRGNLKWVLYKYLFSKKDNYVIAPSIVYEIETESFKNNQYIDEKGIIPLNKYKTFCEKAIEDIPKLAKHIEGYFSKRDCNPN